MKGLQSCVPTKEKGKQAAGSIYLLQSQMMLANVVVVVHCAFVVVFRKF